MKHGYAPRNIKRDYIYRRWQHMVQRCHNPNDQDFARYGAQGIYVCDRWRFGEGGVSGFTLFMQDIGQYARRHLTLDRIDNSKGYEPHNVRWATAKEQANNRSSTRFLTIDGDTRPLSEWSAMYGIGSKTILYRLKRGMSHAEAITTPLHTYSRWSKHYEYD
jgi:hypothetical protein